MNPKKLEVKLLKDHNVLLQQEIQLLKTLLWKAQAELKAVELKAAGVHADSCLCEDCRPRGGNDYL